MPGSADRRMSSSLHGTDPLLIGDGRATNSDLILFHKKKGLTVEGLIDLFCQVYNDKHYPRRRLNPQALHLKRNAPSAAAVRRGAVVEEEFLSGEHVVLVTLSKIEAAAETGPLYIEDNKSGSGDQISNFLDLLTLMNENAGPVKRAYRWYLAHGIYNMERASFLLMNSQLVQFMNDVECTSVSVKSEISQYMTKKKRVLNLRDFAEALVRMADAQYRGRLNADDEPMLVEEKYLLFLSENLRLARFFYDDCFRTRVFNSCEVDKVLRRYADDLLAVHEYLVSLASTQKCEARMHAQRQLTPSASPTKHYERDALGRPTKALHSNHVTLGDLSRLVKAAGLSNANKGDGSEYRTKSEIGLTNGLSNSNVVYIFFASNFEEDEVNNWNDWDYTMERCSRLALLCFRRTAALLALVDRFPGGDSQSAPAAFVAVTGMNSTRLCAESPSARYATAPPTHRATAQCHQTLL